MSRANQEPEYRRRIREKTKGNQQETQAERQKTAENAKHYEIVRSVYAIYQEYQRHNDEERSRKKGDRFWEIGGVLGLWLAAIVGIAAISISTHDASEQRFVMQQQLNTMGGQLDVMENDQRPWLSAKVTLDGPLNYDAIGLSAPFNFDIRNAGKGPAVHVFADALIFDLHMANATNQQFDKDTDRLCLAARSGTRQMSGNFGMDFVLFPNDTQRTVDTPVMNRADVERNRTERTSSGNPTGGFIPYVLGCVNYRTAEGKRHTTAYLFWLTLDPSGAPNLDNVPISQFDLRLIPIGSHGD